MKKIGFIDYYLDEWHANNYPQFFKESCGDRFEVFGAWAAIDAPFKGGMTNAEWSKKYNIPLYDSMEKLIEESDCLVVLSPDNPEMHEKLCEIPLKSGKNTYVDKTFATDKAMAERIFENADKHGTKCYSSSALFFADEYKDIDTSNIEVIESTGPGVFEIYSIHQIEPITKLMGGGAKRIMSVGSEKYPAMIIEYADGRKARFSQFFADGYKFSMRFGMKNGEVLQKTVTSDFFGNCIKAMGDFFDTGIIPVPHSQTVEVIAMREAGLKAIKNPGVWFEI